MESIFKLAFMAIMITVSVRTGIVVARKLRQSGRRPLSMPP